MGRPCAADRIGIGVARRRGRQDTSSPPMPVSSAFESNGVSGGSARRGSEPADLATAPTDATHNASSQSRDYAHSPCPLHAPGIASNALRDGSHAPRSSASRSRFSPVDASCLPRRQPSAASTSPSRVPRAVVRCTARSTSRGSSTSSPPQPSDSAWPPHETSPSDSMRRRCSHTSTADAPSCGIGRGASTWRSLPVWAAPRRRAAAVCMAVGGQWIFTGARWRMKAIAFSARPTICSVRRVPGTSGPSTLDHAILTSLV